MVRHDSRVNLPAAIAAENRLDALLEPREFARQRGWSEQELSEAVAARRVFSVELINGTTLIPALFADARLNQRQIQAVCKVLEPLPGGSKWQFFSTGKGFLGGQTPLQALMAGRLRAVKACAEGFRER